MLRLSMRLLWGFGAEVVGEAPGGEKGTQFVYRGDKGFVPDREGKIHGCADKGGFRREVCQGCPEAPGRGGGAGGFGFDDEAPRIFFEHKVDFASVRGPVIGGGGAIAPRAAGFDDSRFPLGSPGGMAEEGVEVGNAEEAVRESCIAQIEFWGLDEALLHVALPCGKLSQEEGLFYEIEPGAKGGRADAEGFGDLARVEGLTLEMGHHCKEPLEDRDRRLEAKHREVALEIRADEGLPPAQAVGIVGSEEGFREAPSQQKAQEGFPIGGALAWRKGREFEKADSACQALAALVDQAPRGWSEEDKAPGPALAVDDAAEDGEEGGQGLNFVENDEILVVHVQEELGIGKLGEVGRAFQVEVEAGWPVAGKGLGQGGLAGLARSEEYDRGKDAQVRLKSGQEFSLDITMHIGNVTGKLHG